ncbi:CocE/NonD family hydrolase [Paraburkholderia xenovorans]|uniref:CocE/NonD family hydrolase n=1 Tax=Paraburkholderia xenovorans TaxID=36873 RepID=UPI0038B8E3F2
MKERFEKIDTKNEFGMRIIWDAAIEMDDGIILRADVFLPEKEGKYPVIMTFGPYAKGLAFQDGYKVGWERMVAAYPEILQGSTNKLQNWETVDPEKWVPDGYVCVRVDSRGSGRSPGKIDLLSPREIKDFYDSIEWAGTQAWSSGKVGINGISYYAINQWLVASLQPPHLTACCVWEGAADWYRDWARHGGILSQFDDPWFDGQIASVQYGVGESGGRSRVTGELVAGPEVLPPKVLAENRVAPYREELKRPFDGPYYRERSPDYSRVTVPLLSAANWGGMGCHPRGNFEGYLAAASTQKWLEVHGDTHFAPFYRDEGVTLQKRFFGHFLKGENTGWDKQPSVQLAVRRPGENFTIRGEQEWPLARTQWTRYYLDPDERRLDNQPKHADALEYDAMGDGVTFFLPASKKEVEITGPVAARLYISSDTTDADLFLALQLFDPDGDEVLFIGTNDPRVPIGLGWLRASQRKLDPKLSLPYRPYHTHDEAWPLVPGDPVELLIEILPTCIVIPPGYRLALNVRGKDYENGFPDARQPGELYTMKGVGPFTHADPADRPLSKFGGKNRLHFEAGKEPYLLLPIIP